jgi:hypothetical protein
VQGTAIKNTISLSQMWVTSVYYCTYYPICFCWVISSTKEMYLFNKFMNVNIIHYEKCEEWNSGSLCFLASCGIGRWQPCWLVYERTFSSHPQVSAAEWKSTIHLNNWFNLLQSSMVIFELEVELKLFFKSSLKQRNDFETVFWSFFLTQTLSIPFPLSLVRWGGEVRGL